MTISSVAAYSCFIERDVLISLCSENEHNQHIMLNMIVNTFKNEGCVIVEYRYINAPPDIEGTYLTLDAFMRRWAGSFQQ